MQEHKCQVRLENRRVSIYDKGLNSLRKHYTCINTLNGTCFCYIYLDIDSLAGKSTVVGKCFRQFVGFFRYCELFVRHRSPRTLWLYLRLLFNVERLQTNNMELMLRNYNKCVIPVYCLGSNFQNPWIQTKQHQMQEWLATQQ